MTEDEYDEIDECEDESDYCLDYFEYDYDDELEEIVDYCGCLSDCHLKIQTEAKIFYETCQKPCC